MKLRFNKFKIFSKLTILYVFLSPVISFAAGNSVNTGNCVPNNSGVFPNCIPQNDLVTLLNKIITISLGLVGTVALLFLIIGGFQYISSAGNPDSVGKAKNTILYAIIGIIVTLVSWAVVQFVIGNIK